MMIDAKLEKTPGQKAGFGAEIVYGKKGKYAGLGYETASRKTQLKFGYKNLGLGYDYSGRDHKGRLTACYQRGLK